MYTIIEVAVSAIGGKARAPGNPVSPDEVSATIASCLEAGAAIAHNHIDQPAATGPAAAARYGECWRDPLARFPEAILYPTIAGVEGDSPLGRYEHIVETATRHGGAMGVLDPGSVNLTASRADGQPDPLRSVPYINSYAMIDRVLTAYEQAGLPSSIAIFDPTFLRATVGYARAGRLVPGSFVKFYFGGDHSYVDGKPGVGIGLPPAVAALDLYLGMLGNCGLPWAVAVLGGDLLAHRDLVTETLRQGGHLRVGLEDHAGPDQPTNTQLVAAAARLCRDHGRAPASPREARKLLGFA